MQTYRTKYELCIAYKQCAERENKGQVSSFEAKTMLEIYIEAYILVHNLQYGSKYLVLTGLLHLKKLITK